MQTFLYILLAILILLVMVTIHEFGHYLAAKIFKFKVTEFSIGFGPKLFQKTKKNGEKFSLRVIPLGGYCAFDDVDENGIESERAFCKEKPYKRIVVLASGAALNLVSAVLFSFIYLVSVGYASPVVSDVTRNPETGAFYNQLEQYDEILAVDGYKISPTVSLSDAIAKAEKNKSSGQAVMFSVLRDGQERNVEAARAQINPTYAGFGFEYSSPVYDNKGKVKTAATVQKVDAEFCPFIAGDQINSVYVDGDPKHITQENTLYSLTKDIPVGETVLFGVVRNGAGIIVSAEKQLLAGVPYEGYGFRHDTVIRNTGFGKSLMYSVPFTGKMAWSILGALGGLFTGEVAVTDMAGPIGTVTQIAEISQADWRNILVLLPLLAANLAVFNLLPIPALDGSKIILTLIEWIRGKPINRNVENMIHFIGLIALLLFVLTIDIIGFIFRGGAGSGWLRL